MAKILLDTEMAEIIHNAVHDHGVIDCADSYRWFLADLAELICNHFGGEVGNVGELDDNFPYTVGFHINDSVPADGGVFNEYDTDVVWLDGKEGHKV